MKRPGYVFGLAMTFMLTTSIVSANWVAASQSSIKFRFTQLGGTVHGQFPEFTIDAQIDPDRIEECRLAVTIDITSIDTENRERDNLLRGPDFFDTAQFPMAEFRSSQCRRLYGRAYEADGTLTLKGQSRQITLPIELRLAGDRGARNATAHAKLSIRRLQWRIGQGIWSNTMVVADPVFIDINVTARETN